MKESLKRDFVDEKGTEYTLIAEGSKAKLPTNKTYKLQHEFKNKKEKVKGIFTSDIGVHSSGFAGIMGLAMIIAIAGIIVAYLLWGF